MKKDNDRDYYKNISTPNWERFKKSVEGHIECLKEMEKKDKNFQCHCRICRCGALNIVETQ